MKVERMDVFRYYKKDRNYAVFYFGPNDGT